MKSVNVHQAKTQLSAVLHDIETNGEEYVVCRNGTPIADLVPHEKRDRLKTDPFLRRVKVKCDLTKPLTQDDWSLT